MAHTQLLSTCETLYFFRKVLIHGGKIMCVCVSATIIELDRLEIAVPMHAESILAVHTAVEI